MNMKEVRKKIINHQVNRTEKEAFLWGDATGSVLLFAISLRMTKLPWAPGDPGPSRPAWGAGERRRELLTLGEMLGEVLGLSSSTGLLLLCVSEQSCLHGVGTRAVTGPCARDPGDAAEVEDVSHGAWGGRWGSTTALGAAS